MVRADREQFAQLIGYSVSGFNGLPYVSDGAAIAANEVVEKLIGPNGGPQSKNSNEKQTPNTEIPDDAVDQI